MAGRQTYFEDVEVGSSIPPLEKDPTTQQLVNYAGELGWLKKLSVQYRGMDQPGSKVTCKGNVTKKYSEGGNHLVDCEIWLENATGEKTTLGKATVLLPSRNAH